MVSNQKKEQKNFGKSSLQDLAGVFNLWSGWRALHVMCFSAGSDYGNVCLWRYVGVLCTVLLFYKFILRIVFHLYLYCLIRECHIVSPSYIIQHVTSFDVSSSKYLCRVECGAYRIYHLAGFYCFWFWHVLRRKHITWCSASSFSFRCFQMSVSIRFVI